MYTKEQVEEIIKRIIFKDSFGDVHCEAQKVAKELKLDIVVGDKEFQKIRQDLIEEYGYSQDEMDEEGIEGELNLEARSEFRYKYGFEYEE